MIWTIGHSTRTHAEVFEMLFARDVDVLIDVRSYPSSRHCPQWGQDEIVEDLPGWLTYAWMGDVLGGKRKALPPAQSLNNAWRNASFRGYADYMQTPEFADGLAHLIDIGETWSCAIMCAEAVWWRCHRSLIADALVSRGVEVTHIMSMTKDDPHTLRDFAVVEGSVLHYPEVA